MPVRPLGATVSDGPKNGAGAALPGLPADWGCIRKIAALGTSSFVMSFTDSLVQVVCNATLQAYGGDLYVA